MRFIRTFANRRKVGITEESPVLASTFQGVRASDGDGLAFSEWYCMIGEKVAIAAERR
jgi:hypothetical protein